MVYAYLRRKIHVERLVIQTFIILDHALAIGTAAKDLLVCHDQLQVDPEDVQKLECKSSCQYAYVQLATYIFVFGILISS